LLRYHCDWCQREKRAAQRWILGFAAERIGAVSAEREISIAAEWSEAWAGHPLAVHFCCQEHKRNYVRALLADGDGPRPRDARRRRKKGANSAPVSALVVAGESRAPKQARAASRRKPRGRKHVDRDFAGADQLRAHALGVSLGGSWV
jgi:hypothetical protein